MSNNFFEKIKSFKKYIIPIFLVVFVLLTSLISYKVFATGKNILKITSVNSSLLGQVQKFAFNNKKLKGENEGRTNILLLGVGGEGHDGSMLTDTIMILSIKYENNTPKVSLISIPRDLYVDLKDVGNVKINSIYAIDKANNSDQNHIVQAITDVTGLPINYYVEVDFDGFQKAIDAIGGVDVNVEHSFTDDEYPGANYGWQTISFEKGPTHMNGETALEFARSRHGIVTDGSDAYEANDGARSKRQQQIIDAAKQKIMSFGTISNPQKISSLLSILGDHVRTNLELWEIIRLGELATKVDSSNVKNQVIDDSPNGLLYQSSAPDGAFIYLPKSNNFLEIHHFCQNVFEPQQTEIETASIKIYNGTETPDLANDAAAMISYDNLKILSLDNTKDTNYNNTIIYDNSNNKKPTTLEFLRNRFDAKIIKTSSIPDEFKNDPENPDIILIIGKNFSQLPKYEY